VCVCVPVPARALPALATMPLNHDPSEFVVGKLSMVKN
jgi:hypothetical protein